MIWFLAMFLIMNDGTATGQIHSSRVPQYNNETDCNEVGKTLVDQLQKEVGETGKAYYFCQPIELDEIKKGLKTGDQL